MEALDILESLVEAMEVLEAAHNLLPVAAVLFLLTTKMLSESRKQKKKTGAEDEQS